MANYTIPKGTYTSLKDIMGTDFNAAKSYNVYINDYNLGLVQVIDDDSDADARGKEISKFATVEVGTAGASVYFRGTAEAIDIWVEEITIS